MPVRNKITPLTRCKIDTTPGRGNWMVRKSRFFGRWVFMNDHPDEEEPKVVVYLAFHGILAGHQNLPAGCHWRITLDIPLNPP